MTDFSCFVSETQGRSKLVLQVGGMRCASCAWRIESTLGALPGVQARINFSTERLTILFDGGKERANDLAQEVEKLGFVAAPFDQRSKYEQDREEERKLLRYMAVAGFASGNIMLFSLSLWFAEGEAMGEATRELMHWIMALISLPTIIYSGRPFFASAWRSLRSRHANMDVPISLAVILASLMSLHETVRHGPYVYFDASVMLLFFLLIGRYLDKKARGRARDAAQGLLAMLEGTASIVENAGIRHLPIRDLQPGMVLRVAAGEKIAADGEVVSGMSEADTSLVTGETMPRTIRPGDTVYGGLINLSAPIEVRVRAAGDKSLLADIVALMEKAEQGQARYVHLADRVAALYTPAVHALALLTFAGWWIAGAPWQQALLNATAVLIITCPCALGLAVPVVQVLASGFLFRRGMLLKSGNALEKLAAVRKVVFDKTGTLTLGVPSLLQRGTVSMETMQLAASMAAHSRHPLSQALAREWNGPLLPLEVSEIVAHGLESRYQGKTLRLGKRSWCGDNAGDADNQPELWLNDGERAPTRFVFADALRNDSRETIAALKERGLNVALLSGDRSEVAARVAKEAGIDEVHAEVSPVEKTQLIEAMTSREGDILMVGDGLNDAPALSAASVSMSPSSAVDITQNAADIVFRGDSLRPVATAIDTARFSHVLVKQNLALSLLYNLFAVPLAMMGMVTPLIAAAAMSGSSLLVIGNSFRLKRLR